MCKFDQYLHTSRKSGINVYAICVGWVNFVHNLRCLLKNLRSQQKFYATAGPTGPDKYELCAADALVWRNANNVVSTEAMERRFATENKQIWSDVTLNSKWDK